MPSSSALNLIIDITNPGKQGIIQSFQNRLPASVPLFVRNDVESVSLRFVQPSAGSARPWDDVDYSVAQTILGLGEFDVVPTSGTNTFQFGPKTLGTTNSTTTVTITGSTVGIVNGMKVAGTGIVAGTTIAISGSTVTLSVAATSSGTGIALYFYDETASIATGASASTVSTAVNSLASVIAAGGVTVTAPEPGAYLIVLTTPGVTPGYFSGNPGGLNPASSLVVSEVVIGASGISSEQLIEIFVNPYALNETWTNFPSASGVFTTIAAGATLTPTGTTTLNSNSISSVSTIAGVLVGMTISGVGIPSGATVLSASGTTIIMSAQATANGSTIALTITSPNIQLLTLTPGAYDGSFQITTPLITTTGIPVIVTGTTATTVQAALNALGAAYTVTGNPGGPFTISIPGAASAYTSNVTGLIVPLGLIGTLNLSTYSMLQKFITANTNEITLDLECQVTPSGGGQSTPLQLSVLVNKNVVNLSALVPYPTISYLSEAQADARYLQIINWLNSNPTILSVSSTSSSSVARGAPTTIQYVSAGAGSGTYTYSLTLTTAGALRGDRMELTISMPASTNPTVSIIGATTESVIGTGLSFKSYLLWTFNGTGWDLNFRSA